MQIQTRARREPITRSEDITGYARLAQKSRETETETLIDILKFSFTTKQWVAAVPK